MYYNITSYQMLVGGLVPMTMEQLEQKLEELKFYIDEETEALQYGYYGNARNAQRGLKRLQRLKKEYKNYAKMYKTLAIESMSPTTPNYA